MPKMPSWWAPSGLAPPWPPWKPSSMTASSCVWRHAPPLAPTLKCARPETSDADSFGRARPMDVAASPGGSAAEATRGGADCQGRAAVGAESWGGGRGRNRRRMRLGQKSGPTVDSPEGGASTVPPPLLLLASAPRTICPKLQMSCVRLPPVSSHIRPHTVSSTSALRVWRSKGIHTYKPGPTMPCPAPVGAHDPCQALGCGERSGEGNAWDNHCPSNPEAPSIPTRSPHRSAYTLTHACNTGIKRWVRLMGQL